MKKIIFIFSLLLLPSQLFAIVDGQLLVGKRFTTFKSDDSSESITANESQLSLHVDPIPLIPVSFGLFYTMHNYDSSKSGDVFALSEFKGQQVGLEVSAWLPFDLFDLGLYGKAGYAFWGKYEGSGDGLESTDPITDEVRTGDVSTKYSVTGVKLGVGVKWSPIAIVSGMIEVNYTQEKFALDEYKYNGTKSDSDSDDIDANSYAILLGVEAGL